MRALETESNSQAEELGEDAAFLRALVLDGRWEDAITLIEPLRPGTTVHKRACFEIQKQAFLEQLENKGEGDNATALVKALHELEPGSSTEEFNDLCYCLTLPGLRSHPDYASWTPHLGRLWCFEALRGYLGLLFPGQETPTESVPDGQLELLCQQACLHQAEQRRQEDPHAHFPSSVVGGILSDVWSPKDASGSGRGTSEISTASTTPRNSERGLAISPMPSAVRRHRRAGGEGGARGAVSRSQPLGWVLSCVSGEQWGGCVPDREQSDGTLRAPRARHRRSSTVGRDRDMPGIRSTLDLQGGMHSVPVTPSGSLLAPATPAVPKTSTSGSGSGSKNASAAAIKLTSPSSAGAAVDREGRRGEARKGGSAAAGNGVSSEETAASPPPIAGDESGARQRRQSQQKEGVEGQQWRPPPAKEEERRASAGVGEAVRLSRSHSRRYENATYSPALISPRPLSSPCRLAPPSLCTPAVATPPCWRSPTVRPSRSREGPWVQGPAARSGRQTKKQETRETANAGISGSFRGGKARGTTRLKENREDEWRESNPLDQSASLLVVPGGSSPWRSPSGDGRAAAAVSDDGDGRNGTDGGRAGDRWYEGKEYVGDAVDDAEGDAFPFDRLSREEAPRFVPTVVLTGSHPVRSVGFSADGGLFAAGSNDRRLRVCKTPSEADLSSNTNMANSDSGLKVWSSEEVVRRENLHRGSIYCLAFSPDSSLLATGSNDKTVRLLKLPGAAARAAASAPEGNEDTDRVRRSNPGTNGHPYDNNSNNDHSDGRGDDNLVGDVALRGHTGTIRDICFPSLFPSAVTPAPPSLGSAALAGRLLSVGAGDFACRVWDVEGGVLSGGGGADLLEGGMEPVATFRGHSDTVFSCSMLPGGDVAVTGGADSFVRVWDTRTAETVRSLVVEGKEVLCVRPWPGDPERLISTAHSDGYVFLWDMRTGRALSSVLHHTDQTRSLDFSQDGSSLITASYDGLVGICDCRPRGASSSAMATATTISAATTTDSGSSAGMRSMLSGDGRRGSVTEDPEVDVSMLSMLRAHGGRVLQGKWKPRGGMFGSGRRRQKVGFGRPAFLTSSTDCTVMLWTLPPGTATTGARAY
ncbi:unnamed protein product [Scytosiphon promiscuus]